MENDLIQSANEAMQLECNVSKLYMVFRDAYSEDAEFWWKLIIEESNHEALIRSGIEYFMSLEVFPNEIFPSMEDLQEANKELLSLLESYEKSPPTRETAFNLALKIERSAGEIHFQNAMTKDTDSKALKLFQKLNQDDKDHEKRIRAYMKEKGIVETV
jgi:hypothetical protein